MPTLAVDVIVVFRTTSVNRYHRQRSWQLGCKRAASTAIFA
jgi:hypothetical protein